MKLGLLVVGAALVVAGAGGYIYVTAAAADCDTTPGRLGQALDPDIRGQCRMAGLIINAALILGIIGLVMLVLGLVR